MSHQSSIILSPRTLMLFRIPVGFPTRIEGRIGKQQDVTLPTGYAVSGNICRSYPSFDGYERTFPAPHKQRKVAFIKSSNTPFGSSRQVNIRSAEELIGCQILSLCAERRLAPIRRMRRCISMETGDALSIHLMGLNYK